MSRCGSRSNPYLNKRVIILRNDIEIESKDIHDAKYVPNLDDTDEDKYIVQGELLVARRVISVHVKENEEVLLDNIFHTRCHMQNKVCSMIIDRAVVLNCENYNGGEIRAINN